MTELTEDRILNGNILLLQPKDGYRVAIDPIILASQINMSGIKSVLDVGCGVGTISLILKKKNDDVAVTAIDIDDIMCEICKKNAVKNFLDINVINVGIENIRENNLLRDELFDCVVTNPPFFEVNSSRISEKKLKANFETMALSEWIANCLKKLKNKGILTMIHSAHRIDDILCALKGRAGAIEITPLFPKKNFAAKRVIVKCVKGSKAPPKISHGLILHNENGEYTEELKKILQK